MRSRDGGHLTAHRARFRHRENKASRYIYRARHNGRDDGGAPVASLLEYDIMHFARSWFALAALLPAFSACAQPAPPTSAGGMTLDQFLARQTGRIMAADTDGNGKVSRAEMAAMAKNGRDPSRRFDAMDTNHDGMLDASEIREALTQHFHRLDRNGDGMLTPDERMADRMRARQAAPLDPAASPQP